MASDEKRVLLFERNSLKTARIVYKRIFGHISTDDSEGEIRFCQEIFRCKQIRHSQSKRMPPLQKF